MQHNAMKDMPSQCFAVGCLTGMLMVSGMARAEEPKGCDGFKWSLKHEADLLQAPRIPVAQSGATAQADGTPLELKLVAFDSATLPVPPERRPKKMPSEAGFLRYEAPKAAGSYQVTLSQGAWIDVIQDGKMIKPSAFSGATDCPGVRKSIRVTLTAVPFTLQISGLQVSSIRLIAAPGP